MALPKTTGQKIRSPRGQILILFLLILVVGMAIVLSVASRTVTDIRITTTSDESNRAYFAAEAGIEEALKQISTGNINSLILDFGELNDSEANVDITPGLPAATFVYPTTIPKDGVGQVVLMDHYSPPTQANLNTGSWGGGTLEFFWEGPAAIEVSIIYATLVGADYIISGPDSISKQIFDPSGVIGCPAFATSQEFPTTGFTVKADRKTDKLNILGNSETCTSFNRPAGTSKPIVARIRTLNGPTAFAVKANVDLPSQGFKIESSGNTPSGVTRKLEVTRLYPSVPSLFDYVLFNGGSSPLEK